MIAEIFAVVFEFIFSFLIEIILWVFIKPLQLLFRLIAAIFIALWGVLTSLWRMSRRK